MNWAFMESRTRDFAVNVMKFLATLPNNALTRIVVYQLTKSATSLDANYREAGRVQSRNDFINKMAVVEKETAAKSKER